MCWNSVILSDQMAEPPENCRFTIAYDRGKTAGRHSELINDIVSDSFSVIDSESQNLIDSALILTQN